MCSRMPPAFILSRDQNLHEIHSCITHSFLCVRCAIRNCLSFQTTMRQKDLLSKEIRFGTIICPRSNIEIISEGFPYFARVNKQF
ncbi:hypothetical protein H6P81_021300 [Aristolochia fimbriata]|uniref:Uncharacterized protein n=1 Tax=Aristolochia fimbriata TaxID=158543 RepID=A0AAV7DU09_ARIFI|nr:hypothetical protein H6P81_021300 [Aristolochia fimbriata]